ncbi:uncharacterized protein LOC133035838 [Cannabis sativa]|uniref:uncharacterized protein LOC133035838 n=1 Tax=Cannabis sativa TaxID=3483 RepID=UPI0029C9DB59|nr:uncharacterized protein LOC133035838 [Cannabis sativa]
MIFLLPLPFFRNMLLTLPFVPFTSFALKLFSMLCWNALDRGKLGNLQAIDLQSRKHSIRIVLDELNQVKVGFSRPFVGSVPPTVAEAKAILYAMGSNVHLLPIDVIKKDCKTIVDKLKSCS